MKYLIDDIRSDMKTRHDSILIKEKEENRKHNELIGTIEDLKQDNIKLNIKNSILQRIIIYLTLSCFLLATLTIYYEYIQKG